MKLSIEDATHFAQKNKPQFVVFEGINGCGKTTLRDRVAKSVSASGQAVMTTREPGGSSIGKDIRKLVLGPYGLSAITELFLFAAERAQHVSEVIIPALDSGQLVLCDRYYFSTVAFQGARNALDPRLIENINNIAISGIQPDLVFLLDISPEVGLKRTKARDDDEIDKFEEETLSYHRRVRAHYFEIAEQSKCPVVVLDGELTRDQLHQTAMSILKGDFK